MHSTVRHPRGLLDARQSLLHPHLRASWFALAHHSWRLIAQRARAGKAGKSPERLRLARRALRRLGVGPSRPGNQRARPFDPDEGPDPLPSMRRALRELGVLVSDDECLAEIASCGRLRADVKGIERIAGTLIARMHYLHFAALRNREAVRPGFVDLGVQVVADDVDAQTADDVRKFLEAHASTCALAQPASGPATGCWSSCRPRRSPRRRSGTSWQRGATMTSSRWRCA